MTEHQYFLNSFCEEFSLGDLLEKIKDNKEKFSLSRQNKSNTKYAPGSRFGSLTIVDYLGCLRGRKDASLLVLCDCGSISEIHVNTLYALGRDNKDICCTKCRGLKKKRSKYEARIERMLKNLHIPYTREYTVFDCKNPITNHALTFDFYLPHNNAFIEVHGSQHFYSWTLSPDPLSKRVYRDVLKAEYCEQNGYKLLTVTSKNIDKISEHSLKKLIVK